MSRKPAYTNRQKAAEAKREVAMRERVYGQYAMTADKERRLAIMREIQADYEALAEADEIRDTPPDLFEG